MTRMVAIAALAWLGSLACASAQATEVEASPDPMAAWRSSAEPPTRWLNPALRPVVEPVTAGLGVVGIVGGYGVSLALSFSTPSGCEHLDYLRIPLVGGIASAASFACSGGLGAIAAVPMAFVSILQILGTILTIVSGFFAEEIRATDPRALTLGREGITIAF